ncbi:hypothetical protein [Streptomyces sp. NPDC127098]|uniref:hypothetical protein n=1 Tax=Streptomyces sp. NPDC127098 TaxID=3347137 RepID=UPI0036517F2A
MLFLVVAVAVFGVLLGTAAHIPPTASLVVGAAIGCYLVALALRERRRAGAEERR